MLRFTLVLTVLAAALTLTAGLLADNEYYPKELVPGDMLKKLELSAEQQQKVNELNKEFLAKLRTVRQAPTQLNFHRDYLSRFWQVLNEDQKKTYQKLVRKFDWGPLRDFNVPRDGKNKKVPGEEKENKEVEMTPLDPKAAKEVLKATKVRLEVKDMPVPEAVAAFVKKSGKPVFLEDAKTLGKRKITLDTRDVPFWDALELLCKEAGLVEATADGEYNNSGRPRHFSHTDQITLRAGKFQALPAQPAGALRLQAMPRGTPLFGIPKQAGQSLLVLQITLEPGMQLTEVTGLRIDKAIDERDQRLEAVPTGKQVPSAGLYIPKTRYPDYYKTDPGYAAKRFELTHFQSVCRQNVGVLFRGTETPVNSLKEVSGTLACVIFPGRHPILRIDDLGGSTGKPHKIGAQESITLHEVSRRKDGLIKVRVEVVRAVNRKYAPYAVYRDDKEEQDEDADLPELFDGAGKKFKLIDHSADGTSEEVGEGELIRPDKKRPKKKKGPRDPKTTTMYTLLFKGKEEPARLDIFGSQPVAIEVPFVLKNAPLEPGSKAAAGAPAGPSREDKDKAQTALKKWLANLKLPKDFRKSPELASAEATDRVFGGKVFFTLIAGQRIPVGRDAPKGLGFHNLFAVAPDGSVKHMMDNDALDAFFKAELAPTKDEAALKDALRAYLHLYPMGEKSQPVEGSIKVIREKQGARVTGKYTSGTEVALSFDAEGKLTRVLREYPDKSPPRSKAR